MCSFTVARLLQLQLIELRSFTILHHANTQTVCNCAIVQLQLKELRVVLLLTT